MNVNLQAALINSISCGDEVLNKKLQEQIHPIILVSDLSACNQGLKYLYVKKDLLNYAISYSSGLIDLGHKESEETGEAKTTTIQEGKSSSQRTSNSLGCAWADSTGFRNYRRDAYSTDDSYSNTGKDGTSVSNRNGYDKSTSWTNGMNHFYNFLNSTIRGDGTGKSRTTTKGNSKGSGSAGTPAPLHASEPTLNENNPPALTLPTITNWDPLVYPIGVVASTINSVVGGAIGFLQSPDENTASVPSLSGDLNCEPIAIGGGGTVDYTALFDACSGGGSSGSSMGSFERTFSATIPVPSINLTLTAKWGGTSSVSTDYFCGSSASYSEDKVNSELDYSQIDDATGGTYALTKQFSGFNKNKHQHADSEQRTKSYTDAESNGIAESSFESHYKSDRAAHSQRESNGQSTAQAKSITKVRGSSESERKSSEETIYWSQIFDSLQLMWKDTMREIQNARGKITANYKPVSGKIPKTIICSPAQTRYFNESMLYIYR